MLTDIFLNLYNVHYYCISIRQAITRACVCVHCMYICWGGGWGRGRDFGDQRISSILRGEKHEITSLSLILFVINTGIGVGVGCCCFFFLDGCG